MLFFDYHFTVLPRGQAIIFDNEITAEQMGLRPGDGFITFVNSDGTVTLRKIDLTKVEHVSLQAVSEVT